MYGSPMVGENAPEGTDVDSNLRTRLRKWHVPTSPATWGVIGALAGALVSASISYASARLAADTSVRTVQAASEQSNTEFLRNQRLADYTDFLTKSTVAEIAVDDYSTILLASDGSFTQAERNAAYSRLDSAENDYIYAAWRVDMIASDAVRDVCLNMNSVLVDTANTWRIRPNNHIDSSMSASQITDFGTKMNDLRTQFTNASRQEFLMGAAP